MSHRNKKLTALQNQHQSTDNSLEKLKQQREYKSEPKKETIHGIVEKTNPYVRKFNVRKIGHGEDMRRNLIGNTTQLPDEKLAVKTLGQSVEARIKNRLKSLRMHTEKLVSSPYKNSQNDSPFQRSQTVQVRQTNKKDKYYFLTPFEKEEIGRYEVFFIGNRRINSIKDVTSTTLDAKVSQGDAIIYRYEIMSALGQGSFGQVFKAYDHKKRQFVALKIIRNQAKFNKQAKVEIKILQSVIINDPKFKSNIVQLKHAFFFRGHACLVFELLHINLYEFLKQFKFNGFNLDLIRRIIIQVLQGLQFFKRHNIIHCDLKPENILLKQENKTGIKIIDVGSGCYEPEQIYTYIQSRFYRAPEVIIGIPYTSAIDIWSTGCIICELFLGYPIFPGESERDQMLMFMQVLGVPPEDFIQEGSRSHRFFQGNFVKLKPNSKGKMRRPNTKSLDQILGNSSDPKFIDFVKQFLVWRPKQRISPQDALLHPWILQGLPEQIRRQHVTSVKRQFYI